MSKGVRRSVRLSIINESNAATAIQMTPRRSNLRHYRNENENPKHTFHTTEYKTSDTVIDADPVANVDNSKIRKDKVITKRKSIRKSRSEQTVIERNDQRLEEVLSNRDVDEENALFPSPPKIKRSEIRMKKSPSLTPSKLLDRLHLNDNDDCKEEIKVKQGISSKRPPSPTASAPPLELSLNKYQAARKALASCETYSLPGRDQQMKELKEFFHKHLATKTSGSLYVSGQPGTGKTACLSLLLRLPDFSTNAISKIYINCTGVTSGGAIYKKLCSELHLKPAGHQEHNYQTFIENHLKKVNKMFIIVLDEIDELCTMKQSILYTIFEWVGIPRIHVLLIGIANSLDLTERMLKRLNIRYQMKPKHLHFPTYDKQDIIEIFKSRLAQADAIDIFPATTLQLLAAKVSALSGDIRRALDIGRRVVELAEQQNKSTDGRNDVPVNISQVMEVLKNVYGTTQNLQDDLQNAFPLQQKLLLCTIILMLRNHREKDILFGRLHEIYSRICSKRNIQPLDQAEFYSLINLVETRGIFRILHKKESRLSKIMLLWDEGEVNAILCDQQLIASILNDTHCLRR